MSPPLPSVRQWVFDLDNTLYPPSMRLFDQIEGRMTRYVMDRLGVDQAEADRLRSTYWADYGTTLAGLIEHHGIDPHGFMEDVHDIDFSVLTPDPDLANRIAALPGRRIIYTNGSEPYARNVLAARGLGHLFDDIYGVEHAGWEPKPRRIAFERVFAQADITPDTAAMFEDEPRNLQVPAQMGMATIHVAPTRAEGDHIHHHTDDLTGFLGDLI